MAKSDLILSQDGSHTLISSIFGVSYHSKFGAMEESQTIFIEAGFHHILKTGIQCPRIFEMGFGTGLNAFMTLLEAEKRTTSVSYTGIEAYPISFNTAQGLNYPELLDASSKREILLTMHELNSNQKSQLSEHFEFTKILAKIEDLNTTEKFDLIYFDAFSPSAQANLWEEPNIQKMYDLLDTQGVLVTYCAQGLFKRVLKSVGFVVEALPGPTGKREITRAFK